VAAVSVSLTTEDLERLSSLYSMAWGDRSKTAIKLKRALARSKGEDTNG